MMDILVNADVFQKAVLGILLISLIWALFCSWSKGIESAIKVLGISCLLSIFLLALSLNSADLRNGGNGILFILKGILFSSHSIKFEIKEHDLPESDSADATGMFFSSLLVLLIIFVPFFLFGYIASVVEPVKKYLKFCSMRHGKNLFFFAGLEHLAQLEHDRWNAYMRIAGWIRLPLEKTTKKLRKISGVKYILEWSKER